MKDEGLILLPHSWLVFRYISNICVLLTQGFRTLSKPLRIKADIYTEEVP